MADNRYFGGITIGAAGFEVASPNPVDSRFRVKNQEGLAEITSLYEGLISYVESNKTYYQYTNGAWKALSINSAEELEALIKAQIAIETTGAMEFKGATATLPESPSKGDMWKVAGSDISITIDGVAAKTGDTIIYNGEAWVLIPSGDDIEDTWRPIIAAGNTLETNETLELIAGDNVSITEEAGKVTISSSYEDTHYESKLVVGNEATDSANENVVENGNVHLNLVENDEVKSSHKIVGTGGAKVTHLPKGTEIKDEIGTVIETLDTDTIYVDAPNQITIDSIYGDDHNDVAGGLVFDGVPGGEGNPNQATLVFLRTPQITPNVYGAPGGPGIDVQFTAGPDFGFWDEDGERVKDFSEEDYATVKDYVDNKISKFEIINNEETQEPDSKINNIPIIDADGGLADSGVEVTSIIEMFGEELVNLNQAQDAQSISQALGDFIYEGTGSISSILGIELIHGGVDGKSISVNDLLNQRLGFDIFTDENGDTDVVQKIKTIINEAAGYRVYDNTIINEEEGYVPGSYKLLAPLAKIAQTGNVEDLVQTENTYVVFNCGSSSTVI